MRMFCWLGVCLLLISALSCDDESTDSQEEFLKGLHYFRVSSCPEENHGRWQDTSFIIATSNPLVIQQCMQQLALPSSERNLFPLGKIAAGDGSYNRNATHSFSWHYKENEWELVELGIEIYDGCAYSDAELANYQGTLGSYGGWGNRIEEDVTEEIVSSFGECPAELHE